MLAIAAAVTALWPRSAPETVPVLVAAHALAAGAALSPQDVRVVRAPPDLRPEGALAEPAEVAGQVLAGAAAAGEPLTRVRLVGPEGTALAAGPGAAAVPVRPADPALSALLRPGSRVDVVAPADASSAARVVADDAVVLAVRPDEPDTGPLLLLGLPRTAAHEVAAVSLRGPVTVTLR
ncbi:hypothetical protein BJP25_02910 [Actinokineospora bangkokensis]|uniref:SAF domain-containing protein n=1 Tax=Actinokineospora bangkokensis TaxID=1193682 RepID=A0A1Q9LE79_9PSEU|nr:hypothetical protein BJP25_02910 [Actinokineospora bangkokensis]